MVNVSLLILYLTSRDSAFASRLIKGEELGAVALSEEVSIL